MNTFHIEGLHKVLHSVFIYLYSHFVSSWRLKILTSEGHIFNQELAFRFLENILTSTVLRPTDFALKREKLISFACACAFTVSPELTPYDTYCTSTCGCVTSENQAFNLKFKFWFIIESYISRENSLNFASNLISGQRFYLIHATFLWKTDVP